MEQVIDVVDAAPSGVGGGIDAEDMVRNYKMVVAGLFDTSDELTHEVGIPGESSLREDDAAP